MSTKRMFNIFFFFFCLYFVIGVAYAQFNIFSLQKLIRDGVDPVKAHCLVYGGSSCG